jgi:signal transduction histidine kinase
MNLVKNALKFTSKGEIKIQINYKGEPDYLLTVLVTDSGVGFEPEEAPQLFTKFGKL